MFLTDAGLFHCINGKPYRLSYSLNGRTALTVMTRLFLKLRTSLILSEMLVGTEVRINLEGIVCVLIHP